MEDDTQSSREDDDEDIANLFDVVISDPSPADRRAHHNALERRRRDLIKASFHSLQVGVPNITDNKASRAQILKKATSYITMMKDKISKIQYEINMMKEGQKTLEQQVVALEKVKATSAFVQSKGHLVNPENTAQNDLLVPPPTTVDITEAKESETMETPPTKKLRVT